MTIRKVTDIREWVTDHILCGDEIHTVHWSPVAGGRLILDNHPNETEEDRAVNRALLSLDKASIPRCLYLWEKSLNHGLYHDWSCGFYTFDEPAYQPGQPITRSPQPKNWRTQ